MRKIAAKIPSLARATPGKRLTMTVLPLCAALAIATPAWAATGDAASPQPQVTPVSPLHDMERSMMDIQNQMNHMFDNAFSGGDAFGNSVFSPAVNIAEQGGNYVVTVDVPGIDVKDIVATINGNALTISSQMKKEVNEKDKSYIRHESAMSSFERVVQLPDSADADKAEATYKNGQIVVTLPKAAEGKKLSRRLDIKPAG